MPTVTHQLHQLRCSNQLQQQQRHEQTAYERCNELAYTGHDELQHLSVMQGMALLRAFGKLSLKMIRSAFQNRMRIPNLQLRSSVGEETTSTPLDLNQQESRALRQFTNVFTTEPCNLSLYLRVCLQQSCRRRRWLSNLG